MTEVEIAYNTGLSTGLIIGKATKGLIKGEEKDVDARRYSQINSSYNALTYTLYETSAYE